LKHSPGLITPNPFPIFIYKNLSSFSSLNSHPNHPISKLHPPNVYSILSISLISSIHSHLLIDFHSHSSPLSCTLYHIKNPYQHPIPFHHFHSSPHHITTHSPLLNTFTHL
uniref:hypothetical protein n=1 Tax=Bacillus altitudinis TaxID=293387 RepID=UPI001C92DCC2